jgi:hypothetical protein
MRIWHFAAILAVLFLGTAGAIAAPENEAAEAAGQTQQDDKSYLPPWMQKQDDTRTASTGDTSLPGSEISEPANLDPKLKLPATKTQQRRHHNDGFYWSGFGFFRR